MTSIAEMKEKLAEAVRAGQISPSQVPTHPAVIQEVAQRYDKELARIMDYQRMMNAQRERELAAFYMPSVTTASIDFPSTYGAIIRSTKPPDWAHLPDTESVYDEPLCPCGRRHPVWERCRPLDIR